MTETTKACLTFDERPSTPPEISKYRRSTNLEPGRRFQHYGLVDDIQQLNLDSKIFGITDNLDRVSAADLISHRRQTELERLHAIKNEKVYRHQNREPLGRSPDRKINLPSKFTEENLPFGEKSVSLEPVKTLIFPNENQESDAAAIALYKKSHGSYAPGEQKLRGYANFDPSNVRFGKKGDTIAFNGVSKNIQEVLKGTESDLGKEKVVDLKKVENFRNMGDMLGQSKNLGQGSKSRPKEMVYGKPTASGRSAAEVIRGVYREEDNVPDEDLGKSITPGFRNISLENRVFGCPSIRTDIPIKPIHRRSMADTQNYGDDVPAQDLINPPAFSDMGISPMVMSEHKTKDQIIELFSRIGYILSEDVSDMIFQKASSLSQGRGKTCSINAFRDTLNKYLIQQNVLEKK